MAPSFHRLAVLYPHIEFVDIPVSPENSDLHQGFGIQTLPFGHIYYPHAGLVEELPISKRYFKKFVKILETYLEGSCHLPEDGDTVRNPFQTLDESEVQN